VARPNRDGVNETLVAVVLRRAPQIELRANSLNVSREHRDVVALPLAVIEGDSFFLRAPLDSERATPHSSWVFVAD
jgi:hypothetical protein